MCELLPNNTGGAIAGIAIGVAVVAFSLGFLAARWWKKKE
jgi:hypothetical protein